MLPGTVRDQLVIVFVRVDYTSVCLNAVVGAFLTRMRVVAMMVGVGNMVDKSTPQGFPIHHTIIVFALSSAGGTAGTESVIATTRVMERRGQYYLSILPRLMENMEVR